MSHSPGQDRRPWLIISKREAEAILAILRDYIDGAPRPVDEDLMRAERVITQQLGYISGETAAEPSITDTLIREMRA
jgi:hypothetical protein